MKTQKGHSLTMLTTKWGVPLSAEIKGASIMSHIPLPNQESDWAYLLLCVATYIGVFIGLTFVIPKLSGLVLWAFGIIT